MKITQQFKELEMNYVTEASVTPEFVMHALLHGVFYNKSAYLIRPQHIDIIYRYMLLQAVLAYEKFLW